jgi:hypothetical protein
MPGAHVGRRDRADGRSAHGVQFCRWSAATLDLPYPHWLGAWDCPWTCCHPRHEGPLETADTCTTCPDWAGQGEGTDRAPARGQP